MVKNPSVNAGDTKDADSVSGSDILNHGSRGTEGSDWPGLGPGQEQASCWLSHRERKMSARTSLVVQR